MEIAGTPLDASLIRAELSSGAQSCLGGITVLTDTDSTNSALSRMPKGGQHRHAILADLQTRGRGRRSRNWHSPPGGNIYLSLGWRFDDTELPLATLPLAVAVCVCRALDRTGLQNHGIKWPNDILANGRKLAGILVEMQSSGNGPARSVIGVGLNRRMSDDPQARQAIDQPWTDLASELPQAGEAIGRNRLAGKLLDSLLTGMMAFESRGFAAFLNDWRDRDLLNGMPVTLQHNGQESAGIMRGIDDSGAVLIESGDGRLKAWHSGEVSIRHG